MTWTDRLVEWAWSLDLDAVPSEATAAARIHLLDGIGCGLAARRLDEAPGLATIETLATAPAQARPLGSPTAIPAHHAAFATGLLVHALDFDDTHAGGLVHATAPVLAATLAAGEEVGASGRDVLLAGLIGYEAIARIGAAVPHGFHRRGLHATSVCGVFAAALVAARLRGLDPSTAVHALGIAGSMASGSLAFLAGDAATKQLHPGWAASSGLVAAALAGGGATGPRAILEDPVNGFYRAYTDTIPTDPFADLGECWEVTRMTIKPYPACQLVHATLDALATIDAVDVDEIERVTATVPPGSVDIVCEPASARVAPTTAYEAKFSLPWTTAAMLIDGSVTVDTFLEPTRSDVGALAARVTHAVADFDGPEADAPGIVTITLRDDSVRDGRVEISRGGPPASLTSDEVITKFTTNVGDKPQADAIAATVTALADTPQVRDVLDASTLEAA